MGPAPATLPWVLPQISLSDSPPWKSSPRCPGRAEAWHPKQWEAWRVGMVDEVDECLGQGGLNMVKLMLKLLRNGWLIVDEWLIIG